MPLKFSFDPLSGKLNVGFNDPINSTPVSNVTPQKSKTIPKPSPKGGSGTTPSITDEAAPVKDFYLRGETIPEGVETSLETRDIDGKKRLVRVPVIPELTPEQKGRINAAAGSEQFTYGYDPVTGEFATGNVKVDHLGDNKELVNKFLEKANQIKDPIEAADSAQYLGRLYYQRNRIADSLYAAESNGDKQGAEHFKNELLKQQELIDVESAKRGDNFTNDYFVDPLLNVLNDPIDSFNKLTTGTTLVLGESLVPMAMEAAGPAIAGAGAGSVVPGIGSAAGATAGAFPALVGFYTSNNIAEQYLNKDRKFKEMYGENIDTFPNGTIVPGGPTDIARARYSAVGAAALDLMLAKGGEYALNRFGFGGEKVAKRVADGVAAPKIRLPKTLTKKTIDRLVGTAAAVVTGGVTEGGQEIFNILGSMPELGLFDIPENEELTNRVYENFTIGALLPLGIGTMATPTATGVDLVKVARQRARDIKSGVIPSDFEGTTEANIDGKGSRDTSSFETEVTEEVTAPAKAGEPRVEPVSEPNLEERTEPGKSPYDVYSEYYNSRIEQFEKAQKEYRSPSELYEKGIELGLPVGEVFEKIKPVSNIPEHALGGPRGDTPRSNSWVIVDRETGKPVAEEFNRQKVESVDQDKYEILTSLGWLQRFNAAAKDAGGVQPSDAVLKSLVKKKNTGVAAANNVVKGMVEAAESTDFYQKLANDPELLDKFASAVETSKRNTPRQRKVKVVAEVTKVPEQTLDTLPEKDIDTLYDRAVPPAIKETVESVPEQITEEVVEKTEQAAVPPPPITEAKAEEISVKTPARPKASGEAVRELDSLAKDEVSKKPEDFPDPLEIPAFLDRRKNPRSSDPLLSKNIEPDNIRVDNPGGEWLKRKQTYAKENAKLYPRGASGKLLSGSTTAYTRKPVELPLDVLIKIKGAADERRVKGESQFDSLSEEVEKTGWNSEQNKQYPILIGVNQEGVPFILEGNTRVAVAKNIGKNKIFADVRWYNGGEEVEGFLTPEKVRSYSEPLLSTDAWNLYNNELPQVQVDYVRYNDKTPYLDELLEVSKSFNETVKNVGDYIAGKNLSSNIAIDLPKNIIVNRRDDLGNVTTEQAGGQYKRAGEYFIRPTDQKDTWGTVIIAIGDMANRAINGRHSMWDRTVLTTTALHEYIHGIDMEGFLNKTENDLLTRDIKEMQRQVSSIPGMGFVGKFNTDSRTGRSEVIAYYTQEYAKQSTNPAAVAFRKEFGLDRVDNKGAEIFQKSTAPFKEPTPFIKSLMNKLLNIYRALFGKRLEKQMLESGKDVIENLLNGQFGKDLDAAIIAANERQLKAAKDAAAEQSTMFSLQQITEPTPPTNPIGDALKRNKQIATERPNDIQDMSDVLKDPSNTKGHMNKLASIAQVVKGWAAWARQDEDAGFSFQLAIGYQRAAAKLHGAWEKPVDWLRTLPDRDAKLQVLLDLRKQGVSFKDTNEQGQLEYINRKGKIALLNPTLVNELKEVSKVFSLPLDFMVQTSRSKLENINKRPGMNIPFDGTAKELQDWVKEKQSELKEASVKSPEDRRAFEKAKDLVATVVNYLQYTESGKPYIPEMRKGNWALTVKDSKGDVVGMFTLEPSGGLLSSGEPTKKQREELYKQVKNYYRNRPDLHIPGPEEIYQLTYNSLGKTFNPTQIDVNLITSLVSQRAMGYLKGQNKFSEADIDLSGISSKELSEHVLQMFQSRGFGKHLINSKHIDGMSEDFDWVINQFFNSAAKSASNNLYGDIMDFTRSAYRAEGAKTNTPRGRKFSRLLQLLDYALDPAYDAPFIRALSYQFGLAGNPSTAFIQLTPLINNIPSNMVSIGLPLTGSVQAMTEAMRYAGALTKTMIQRPNEKAGKTKISRETLENMEPYFGKDKKAFKYAVESALSNTVILNASLPDEAQYRSSDKYSRTREKVKYRFAKSWEAYSELASSMMSTTERAARVGTYFAHIKMLYNNPAGVKRALSVLNKDASFRQYRNFNPQLDDVQAIASYEVQSSFGYTEKAARPSYTKGVMGSLISPFVGIPAQLWEQQVQNIRGIRGTPGRVGALIAMMQMAVTGGIYAAIPTLSLIMITGLEIFGDKDEPGDLQFKALLLDALGLGEFAKRLGISEKRLADLVTAGIVTELGTDISGRVGNAMPFTKQIMQAARFMATGNMPEASDYLGIPGQLLGNTVKSGFQYGAGRIDLSDALLSVSPAWVRNIGTAVKQKVEKDTGVKKSGQGKEVIRYSEYSNYDILLRSLGFTPLKERDASMRNRVDNLARASKNALKSSVTASLIDLGAKALTASDPSEVAEYRAEYRKVYEEFLAAVSQLSDEERDLYFTDKDMKVLKKNIERGIERRVNPGTEEGLTRAQKQKRKELERFLR